MRTRRKPERGGPLLLGFLAAALLTGCMGSDFTVTDSRYTPAPRVPESVRLATERPGAEYRVVGIVTGSGGSFEGSVGRLKLQAAEDGCEVVVIIGEAVTPIGPGAPRVNKSDIRATCYVRAAETDGGTRDAEPPQAAPAGACTPACRQGYDCSAAGTCVSACNPPCASGESCVGHGAEASCKASAAGAQ